MTTHRFYATLDAGHIDPEEVRRLVAASIAQGLIKTAPTKDAPASIDKTGDAITKPDAAGTRSVWMDVDPGLAAHWLQNNFVNRPMSEDTVKSYARDMINGVWIPTHQGVAFNDLDHLIDGQHRLSAIVMSGCTVRMMVTFGLPSVIPGHKMTTMDAVDRGIAELTLQALHLEVAGDRPERLELAPTGLHAFRALQPQRVAKVAALFNLMK